MPRRTTIKYAFNEDSKQFLELMKDESLITCKAPSSVQELIVSFSIGFNHLFSQNECHRNIKLRNDNKSAKLHKKDGWSRRVHCNQIMKTGLHYIEFEINDLTDDVSIGISNSTSGITRFVGFDRNSYSLSCSGKLQHKSDADFDDPYSSHWQIMPYSDDDFIAMLLDLNKFTLTYYKNDECLGKAFNIINTKNKGYVFAVSMAKKGDMVSIVYDEPDKDNWNKRDKPKVNKKNTDNKKVKKSRKRKLENNDEDDDEIIMPPPKKQKLDEDEDLNKFKESQRKSKFGKDEDEKIDNEYYVGQNIEIYDIDSKKWVKAVVIHSENNWIVVHFDGCSSIYDQKIHVIKQQKRIRSELRLKDKKDKNDGDESDDEVPEEFCDPISFEVMKVPMLVTVSGVTYEKEVIEEYIKENGQDPMTRQKVTIDQIVPNRALRETIERWMKKHPGVIDE